MTVSIWYAVGVYALGYFLGIWRGRRTTRRERRFRREFVDAVKRLRSDLNGGLITINEYQAKRQEAQNQYYIELATIGMDVAP